MEHWEISKPNMLLIGNYLDQETITQVEELLKDYKDLFLNNFEDMKGITRSLEKMKIQLKLGAKPMKK